MLRVPSEDAWQITSYETLSSKEQQCIERKESHALEGLARRIIEEKIRPQILREDVVNDLSVWLRRMLLGPALPYNKIKNFERDILKDEDFISDAEIYVETLPGCHVSLMERNRRDVNKKNRYPDPSEELRVSGDVLKTRCGVMVVEFAKRKHVTDESLQKVAMEEFYSYYKKCIMDRSEEGYNSYTGLSAMFGDAKFMKRSEEIVMFALGLSAELKDEESVVDQGGGVDSAPPPLHTLIVFTIVMMGCFYFLPTMENLDEYATIEIFTTSIFQEGGMHFTPVALGWIRMSFAFFALVVGIGKWTRGVDMKLTYLKESKLRNGRIQMSGWRTQGFFTVSCD